MLSKSPLAGETGVGTVEFLFMVFVLFLVFFGVFDFGRAYYAEICLTNAAYAGAQYGALIPGQSANYPGMQTAANNDDPGTPGFSAIASGYCACSPGGSSVSCASTCSGYSSPLQYVKVQTSGTLTAMLPYPGIPAAFALSATCTLRVQ